MSFLSLDAVKDQLGITSTVTDGDLGLVIAAAGDVIERHVGQVVDPRSFTDEVTVSAWQPTRQFRLHKTPLVSVQQIIDSDGTVYDLTGMVVRASGLVVLPSAIGGYLDITYTAGLSVAPDNYVQAGLIIVQHLWETRRGDMPLATAALDDSLMMDTRMGIVVGYAIPNRALELLGPRPPVVA